MPLSCPLCPQGFSEFRDKETLDEHVCRVHGICTESARHQPKVVTTQVRLQHQGVIQQTADQRQQADGQPGVLNQMLIAPWMLPLNPAMAVMGAMPGLMPGLMPPIQLPWLQQLALAQQRMPYPSGMPSFPIPQASPWTQSQQPHHLSQGGRPQGEVMASQPITAPTHQTQLMTSQGQPQQVQRPQYYKTPGSLQKGSRLQGGQIRQRPTLRQRTPGGGQVEFRPSVSGGIQMVGAQPQSQKQVHQVITGSGQRVRPLIISGQHPGGQRDNIIRPWQHQGVIQQTANEQQQADGQPRAQMSHYQKKKLRFKKILCEICEQDSTTGKHFKVSACNACALFFRRTVRLNKRYNCVLGTGRVVLVLPDRFNPASFSWQKLKTWF